MEVLSSPFFIGHRYCSVHYAAKLRDNLLQSLAGYYACGKLIVYNESGPPVKSSRMPRFRVADVFFVSARKEMP